MLGEMCVMCIPASQGARRARACTSSGLTPTPPSGRRLHAPAMRVRTRRFKNILFVGANGIPAGTYEPFLNALSTTFDTPVTALDLHEAFEDAPVCADGRRSWQNMLDHVKPELPEHDLAVGHSLGAAVLVGATGGKRHCQLALIDPPLFNPRTRLVMELMRRYKFGTFNKIIERTRGAPSAWATREEAEAYLRRKKPYSVMNDATWQCFRRAGLRDRPDGGVELVFSAQTESQIFEATPTEIPVLPWQEVPDNWVGMYPQDSFVNFFKGEAGSGSYGRWAFGGTYYHSARQEFTRHTDLDYLYCVATKMKFEEIDNHFEPLINPEGMAARIAKEIQDSDEVASPGPTSNIGQL